jgi:acyl carrier protein
MLETVLGIFAECLEKSADEIGVDDEFRNYAEWDSLAYLSVIAAIDDRFDYVVPLDDFRSCRTVNALVDYLSAHIEM